MQENFKFLVRSGCLGHYNNEANKKLPDESHLQYVKELLELRNGRDRYKRLCSINHGNRFVSENGEEVYHGLFFKSLNSLLDIDSKLKKKKKFSELREKVAAQPNDMIKKNPKPNTSCRSIIPKNLISQESVSVFLNKSVTEDKSLVPSCTKAPSLCEGGQNEKSQKKVKKTSSLNAPPA